MNQPTMSGVPFGDLKRQSLALGDELTTALAHVAESGWYVLGQEVGAFEAEFAAYCGTAHCIGVASGAEALYLALAALDVGAGAEVITVANACMYQAAAILQAGARPVFVDIDPRSYNLDPQQLEAAITPRTRAIMPVHLYGDLAAMTAIQAIAERHGLPIIEDAAQAHGAWANDGGAARRAGAWGAIACFSFYPSKNLGALGDAGALTTNDAHLAERLRRLRFYGWGTKYITEDHGGRNSRLDEIQAAVLRVKLRHLDAWNNARRERAAWYSECLHGLPLQVPALTPGHVFHLYVIACAERAERDRLRDHLRAHNIGCDIHYPVPTHQQPAYRDLGFGAGDLPVTEAAAGQILSLPIYPELTRAEVEQVAAVVHGFFSGRSAE
jgi:dTDP-3-amino-3,4,6-trideoxy-alpha-D-glucose transaminase